MNCMKCGREIEPGQAFCPQCLAGMEKYPLRPNVVVHLPPHRDPPPKRQAARKPAMTKDDRIHKLKDQIRALWMIILALVVIMGTMGYYIARMVMDRSKPQRGQNYSAVTTPTEATTDDVSRETSE